MLQMARMQESENKNIPRSLLVVSGKDRNN